MKKDKLDILYEDKYVLIVNKPYNLLTVSTIKEKERTLFHKVFKYLKEKNKSNKIFIVHRLDKDTSGIVLFAKSEKTKSYFQNNWDEVCKYRGYIAVVEGIPKEEKGTIKSYLHENKELICYSTEKSLDDGKLAITNYSLVTTNKKYSLLEINIKTGRKNQIRVHLNDIGLPVIGDKKYGCNSNPINRLGLHAYKLEFIHPITKELITIETDVPNEFVKLFK